MIFKNGITKQDMKDIMACKNNNDFTPYVYGVQFTNKHKYKDDTIYQARIIEIPISHIQVNPRTEEWSLAVDNGMIDYNASDISAFVRKVEAESYIKSISKFWEIYDDALLGWSVEEDELLKCETRTEFFFPTIPDEVTELKTMISILDMAKKQASYLNNKAYVQEIDKFAQRFRNALENNSAEDMM